RRRRARGRRRAAPRSPRCCRTHLMRHARADADKLQSLMAVRVPVYRTSLLSKPYNKGHAFQSSKTGAGEPICGSWRLADRSIGGHAVGAVPQWEMRSEFLHDMLSLRHTVNLKPTAKLP